MPHFSTAILRFKDLSNTKFCRLTPLKPVFRFRRQTKWLCKCDCGNFKLSTIDHLKNRTNQSCGCKTKEITSKANTIHAGEKLYPSEYSTWRNMQSRCYQKSHGSYKDYGERGIIVCDRWKDLETGFLNFLKDIGTKPTPQYSIERIDNNGNYEPSNCKWETVKNQNLNQRTTLYVTYKGVTKPLLTWAEELGMKYSTLKCRIIDYKIPVEEAFTRPVKLWRKV